MAKTTKRMVAPWHNYGNGKHHLLNIWNLFWVKTRQARQVRLARLTWDQTRNAWTWAFLTPEVTNKGTLCRSDDLFDLARVQPPAPPQEIRVTQRRNR
jgi:catechol-2,3-dioxygenase